MKRTAGTTIDGVEVFLRLIMQFLGLLFEFLEASFGVTVDDILGVFTDIELGLERLRRANDAFLEAFQTHFRIFQDPPSLRIWTVRWW